MNLEEFYADPLRRNSREIDLGATWCVAGYGPWRIVWIEDSGELVAFNVNVSGSANIGGSFVGGDNLLADFTVGIALEYGVTAAANAVADLMHHHHVGGPQRAIPEELREPVCLFYVETDKKALREKLTGWEDHARDLNGLAWLAERCGGKASNPPPLA